ncbi:MAG: peptidase M50 [Myxococcales bacterium]|nr:peptidase M50 [Myxococcales bacterium]
MIDPLSAIAMLVPLILSLSVHEYAHAQVAYWLGDGTADQMGRRTLNPVAHVDPFGTILFPLLGYHYQFLFGWARPVPVNPMRFKQSVSVKRGMMLVAAAGPASNLILAFLATGGLKLLLVTDPTVSIDKAVMLVWVIRMNLALCLFNLLPVYPLDGSRVLRGLLPRQATAWLDVMEQNPLLLLAAFGAVLYFAGSILVGPLFAIEGVLFKLFQIA